jgi:DNA primase
LGRIPDETIQQVRDRVDIVDLVGRFVSLKPAGRTHKGLCPFHDEKTPSFVVTRDRQSFKCFGCGEGGNAFGFLMRMENLTFPEAVRTLAAEHGIEVPETGSRDAGEIEPLREANEIAQEGYRAALAEPGSPAARYLAERGIDAETIERFGIGWAPDRWDFVTEALRRRRIPARVGERAGLLKEGRSGGHYDMLRGRVVFPIRDVRGRVIGFGGRCVSDDQEPKYLNTPESRAVVVEGYFDLVALHRSGIDGVVATCGTALTEDHARELRRRTRTVVVLFDGDEAGQKAMERSLEMLLPADLRVHAAVLPGGDDPDSFLAREGAEALRAVVTAAPPALEVAIQRAVARGCASPAEKADAVASLARLLVLLPSPVERGAFEDRLALAVGAHVEDVRAAVRAERRGEEPRDAVSVAPRMEPAEVRKLRRLAHSLLEHPHLAPRVCTDPLTDVADQPVVELIRRLVVAAGADRRVDLEEISQEVSAEARSLLYALAAEEHAPEEAAAERTVEDTNRWLQRREERALQHDLTQKLRHGGDDALEILRAKQLQREEASDVPPSRSTH